MYNQALTLFISQLRSNSRNESASFPFVPRIWRTFPRSVVSSIPLLLYFAMCNPLLRIPGPSIWLCFPVPWCLDCRAGRLWSWSLSFRSVSFCAPSALSSLDPDGKRKRRGRKRKTALPEGEEEETDSSGDEEVGEDDATAPMPIGGALARKHRNDELEAFGASLDESQGAYHIAKAKRAKLKEDWNDEADLDVDGVPHLAGPTSHFGGAHPMHHHHHFDEDEHVSAINGRGSNHGSPFAQGHPAHRGSFSAGSNSNGQQSNSTPAMAVPGRARTGSATAQHDDFAHFNIYPELLTLPSPVSGSHQHSQLWFPSPRTTSAFTAAPFETGESHFVSSPIISGLAHSFGNSCGSTSFLNHTPTTQKGFHDFYPSGSSDNPSFDGFIL